MTACPKCGGPAHPVALTDPLKLSAYYCESCRQHWTFGEEQQRLHHLRLTRFPGCKYCRYFMVHRCLTCVGGREFKLHPWPWRERN